MIEGDHIVHDFILVLSLYYYSFAVREAAVKILSTSITNTTIIQTHLSCSFVMHIVMTLGIWNNSERSSDIVDLIFITLYHNILIIILNTDYHEVIHDHIFYDKTHRQF